MNCRFLLMNGIILAILGGFNWGEASSIPTSQLNRYQYPLHLFTTNQHLQRPYRCNQCADHPGFIHKKAFMNHLQKHNGRKSHVCINCYRQFRTKKDALKHVSSGECLRENNDIATPSLPRGRNPKNPPELPYQVLPINSTSMYNDIQSCHNSNIYNGNKVYIQSNNRNTHNNNNMRTQSSHNRNVYNPNIQHQGNNNTHIEPSSPIQPTIPQTTKHRKKSIATQFKTIKYTLSAYSDIQKRCVWATSSEQGGVVLVPPFEALSEKKNTWITTSAFPNKAVGILISEGLKNEADLNNARQMAKEKIDMLRLDGVAFLINPIRNKAHFVTLCS